MVGLLYIHIECNGCVVYVYSRNARLSSSVLCSTVGVVNERDVVLDRGFNYIAETHDPQTEQSRY